jgi:hypothetical protein
MAKPMRFRMWDNDGMGFKRWWDRYRHFRAAQGLLSDLLGLLGWRAVAVSFVLAVYTGWKAHIAQLVWVEQFVLALVAFAAVLFIFAVVSKIRTAKIRTEPQVVIHNLRRRVWPAERHGFTGAECYFEVYNPSFTESLEATLAEVLHMSPDPIGYLPVPLHIKHDDTWTIKRFR